MLNQLLLNHDHYQHLKDKVKIEEMVQKDIIEKHPLDRQPPLVSNVKFSTKIR